MVRFVYAALLAAALLAAALSAADAKCGSHQYAEVGDDSCKSCARSGSKFTKVVGGKRCYFQEASPSRRSCGATPLATKIRSNTNSKKTISCLNPNSKAHTIILPLSSARLPGLKYTHYSKGSLRLPGCSSRKTKSGGVAYSLKTSGVTKGLAITFDDKGGAFKRSRGKLVTLQGVVKHPRTGVNLCFTVTPRVCKVEDNHTPGVEDNPKPDDNGAAGGAEDNPKAGDDNPKGR